MDHSAITVRYAKALFETAKEKELLGKLKTDIDEVFGNVRIWSHKFDKSKAEAMVVPSEYLNFLKSMLSEVSKPTELTPFSVLMRGGLGVGKTTLKVHLKHLLQDVPTVEVVECSTTIAEKYLFTETGQRYLNQRASNSDKRLVIIIDQAEKVLDLKANTNINGGDMLSLIEGDAQALYNVSFVFITSAEFEDIWADFMRPGRISVYSEVLPLQAEAANRLGQSMKRSLSEGEEFDDKKLEHVIKTKTNYSGKNQATTAEVASSKTFDVKKLVSKALKDLK